MGERQNILQLNVTYILECTRKDFGNERKDMLVILLSYGNKKAIYYFHFLYCAINA